MTLSTALSVALTRPASGSSPAPAFDPATLFEGGEQGGVYDFTDENTLYTDSGRTTAVTAPGDQIFGVEDLSGNGNHLSQNRGTPRWQGMPATWGANLVASPLDFSDASWTKGTGWTDGVKTSGTASSLSTAGALTAGKTYMFVLRVGSRSSGTVKAELTGGTTVTHFAGYNAAGEYIEILTAVSGNNTIGVAADSSFAGEIKAVQVREVLSFYDMGVKAEANERLNATGIDMSATKEMTIVVAAHRGRRTGSMIFGQVGQTATANSTRLDFGTANLGARGFGGTASNLDISDPDLIASQADVRNAYTVFAVRRDNGASGIDNQFRLRLNGLDLAQANSGGPLTDQANSASSQISLLSWINNNSLFDGYLYRVIVINRLLSDVELAEAEAWCNFGREPLATITTGDSTWDYDGASRGAGRGNTTATQNVLSGPANSAQMAEWGDDAAEQLAAWNALTTTELDQIKAVIVAPFYNNVGGGIGDSGNSLATEEAELQSLIDQIAADCPDAVLIGAQLADVDAWLTGRTNGAAAIAALDDFNTDLTDGTITGLDAVMSSHLALMNDGSGNLPDLIGTGPDGVNDGIHPGEYGRLCMSVGLREAFVGLGLLGGARAFS